MKMEHGLKTLVLKLSLLLLLLALPSIDAKTLKVDTITPETTGESVDISTTGSLLMPFGTTGERPSSPLSGMFRYNTTTGDFEGYTTTWGAIAGSGGGADFSSVTQDIVPDTTDTYNIGLNSSTQWLGVYADNVNVTSTQNASTPCPLMTAAQKEAVSSPSDGSCVYDTDSDAQYNYNLATTQWLIAGAIVDTENITDWTSFTPSATGFGTISGAEGFYRRVGDSLEITGSFQSGTSTATAASIELPNGLLLDLNKINSGSLSNFGSFSRINGTNDVYASSAYVGDGFSDGSDTNSIFIGPKGASDTAYAKTLGSNYTISGDSVTFNLSVPIDGWESSTKYAATSCDGLACFNTFTARIENNGSICTVVSENLDFISTCDRTGAGLTNLNYNTDMFTVIPSSSASVSDTASFGNWSIEFDSASITQLFVRTFNASATPQDANYDITITRQGADFFDHDERFVPISDQENVYSARIANNGTATVTSESTSFIQTVTRTGGGTVDIVFKTDFFTEAPSVSGIQVDGSGSSLDMHVTTISATGATVRTYFSGGAGDSDFSIKFQRQGADYNEPKAYVGNINPKTLVETPNSNSPKMYSATVSAAGVVSSEVSGWISGNCTNAHPSVCTLESGAFTNAPTCSVTSANSGHFGNLQAVSSSSISVGTNDHAGGNSTTSIIKYVICHGE